jgi:WD40 repeat protein
MNDLGTSREVPLPRVPTGICASALSPEGKLAVLGYAGPFTEDRAAVLWDVESGTALGKLAGFYDHPRFLAFTDASTVLAADQSGLLKTYKLPSRRLLNTLRLYAKSLKEMVLSPDSQLALTVGLDKEDSGSVRVWNLAEGKVVGTISKDYTLFPRALSSDGRLAVLERGADLNAITLEVYEVSTGKVLKTLELTDGWSGPVDFAADNKHALLNMRENDKANIQRCYVVLCELETANVIWKSSPDLGDGRFLPGQREVLAQKGPSTFVTLDARTGETLRSVIADFGELPAADGTMVRQPVFGAVSKDGAVYLAAAGHNYRVYGQEKGTVSNLTVKVWRLGDAATPAKSWIDNTRPD